jgi:hypothetical protein
MLLEQRLGGVGVGALEADEGRVLLHLALAEALLGQVFGGEAVFCAAAGAATKKPTPPMGIASTETHSRGAGTAGSSAPDTASATCAYPAL